MECPSTGFLLQLHLKMPAPRQENGSCLEVQESKKDTLEAILGPASSNSSKKKKKRKKKKRKNNKKKKKQNNRCLPIFPGRLDFSKPRLFGSPAATFPGARPARSAAAAEAATKSPPPPAARLPAIGVLPPVFLFAHGQHVAKEGNSGPGPEISSGFLNRS